MRRHRHLPPRVCSPRGTGILTALVAGDPLGDLPLPPGVAAHARSAVVVCLNGLRLSRISLAARIRRG
jgi:cation transport ATPase